VTLKGTVVPKRKIIVNVAISADGYVARSDGNLDWLTGRPAPKGFYGLPKFSRSIDAKILGRKTFELSVKIGASFSADDLHYVFSRRPQPASVLAGVQFVTEPIQAFAERLRKQAGKNIWMMAEARSSDPSSMRARLTSSTSPSCRHSSGKAFPSLHRGVARCAPAAIFATISGRCGSVSLRRAAIESLRSQRTAPEPDVFDPSDYAAICWARSTMLSETTSKSPGFVLSGKPLPPNSFGR